jgi:rhodanese-related sulfurtransferase
MPFKLRNLRMIGLLLALTAANAGSGHPFTAEALSLNEVANLLDLNEVVYIYDANERSSYLKGHIRGALWVRYDAVMSSDLPPAKDAKLIFYCYNPLCGASELAADRARALGYRNVWRMPEGIEGWRAANRPVVAGASAQ